MELQTKTNKTNLKSGIPAKALNYEPVIDGLRAVAIILVILFHASPSRMPAGFIGVDVFFVISGFLITRLIDAQVRAGEFSYIDFFTRRLLRLAPAAFAVIAVCFALSYLLFTPNHLTHLASSSIWTTL